MLIKQIEVTFMAVFCYLLQDEESGEGALIDPGGEVKKITQLIKEYNVALQSIVNTHGHWDHIAGNAKVAKKTGAAVLIHEADVTMMNALPNKKLTRLLGGSGSPKPTRLLKDGDEIVFGKTKLQVIHTPGHSKGSISLYHDGHLFTGDTLFVEGMGRTDIPEGSYQEIMKSIKTRILVLPENTVIWPGHNYGKFPHSTVGEQQKLYL